ncbi:MAG TPA: YggS family pyridoxal phosphate-dependent enzyme [Methylophilaceae bacterium]|nr:YggS family pyridoxal phosphate-dependent enzyme [Methylophilaceae bacterium]
MTTIAERLQAVKARIHAAEHNAGRAADSVSPLAVSKAQPAGSLREAYAAGQRLFGENYLQEALDKQAALADLAIEWHFIGPIQSNKTQQIARHFSWVHGVDRLKIAERLSNARPEDSAPLAICLQVNISQEASKSGVMPQELDALADAVQRLPRLRLRGLMAIPAPTSDIELQHKQFRMVRELYSRLLAKGHALDTLSMGMSEDFQTAILEGATIIRIGSAIFGPRAARITQS